MRKKVIAVLLTASVLLCGCGGNETGISQEEYDKVVAERDAYKLELEQIKNSNQSTEQESKGETEEAIETETSTGKLQEQVEVKEYSMENSIGDTCFLLLVKNNSNKTISLDVNATAKDSEGKTVGAASSSGEAIGAGHEVCLMNYFDSVKGDSTFEYTMSVKEDEYYESVLGDLTHEDSDTGEKVIVTCTNNGDKAAKFVEGTVLFFLGDKLVGYETNYLTDDDSELKPGASIAEEFEFYGEEDYDRFEVYFTGRK